MDKSKLLFTFAKIEHDKRVGTIIFPNHGSQEVGKGLEKKILKDAGIEFKN